MNKKTIRTLLKIIGFLLIFIGLLYLVSLVSLSGLLNLGHLDPGPCGLTRDYASYLVLGFLGLLFIFTGNKLRNVEDSEISAYMFLLIFSIFSLVIYEFVQDSFVFSFYTVINIFTIPLILILPGYVLFEELSKENFNLQERKSVWRNRGRLILILFGTLFIVSLFILTYFDNLYNQEVYSCIEKTESIIRIVGEIKESNRIPFEIGKGVEVTKIESHSLMVSLEIKITDLSEDTYSSEEVIDRLEALICSNPAMRKIVEEGGEFSVLITTEFPSGYIEIIEDQIYTVEDCIL